ncbi:MAG: cytochrome c [Gemmatimonadaceae bacterium]|nr:cytochrome c [Gemmatimonadaceae bacterium]
MSAKALVRCAAVVALPLVTGACALFTDYQETPSVGTWQEFSADSGELKPFRASPRGSVPVTGMAVAPYSVSYAPFPATVDSLSGLANPVAPDSASLDRGHKYYQINCAVCHGAAGAGDGEATKLGMIPLPLTSDRAKALTDGYLYGMMRNGRGLMASAARIEEHNRWDIVNYVRGLQGKLATSVATGPAGFPGETGDKLPGFTVLGPNTWVRPVLPTLHVTKKGAHGAAASHDAPAKPEGH